ncbi:MAG: thiamine-phosphate kinase [Acidobacteria bacterium]|nr:thiamine-phosphate kinase [Acidobacteriota bacterium]
MPSEFDFIRQIQQKAAAQSAADLVLGIGDDAAVWRERTGRESLITVDLLVEDVDFKLEYTPSRWLGHKALAVSLSDIAAMGSAPRFSLLTLSIPHTLQSQISNLKSENFWEEFFAGYFELAAAHNVILIGGDISSAPDRLAIDSIVIGHCQSGKAIRRDGANVGDAIYVTGSVGASAVGLKLLLNGERVGNDVRSPAFRRLKPLPPEGGTTNAIQAALRAHLRPEPRVQFGRRLGELGLATAMIDVSDGLAQDLGQICDAGRVGAVVEFDAVPVAEEVRLITANANEAFEFAVSGGEDFELLFTAIQGRETELMTLAANCQLRLTRIGEIIGCSQPVTVFVRRNGEIKPLSIRCYNHFGV